MNTMGQSTTIKKKWTVDTCKHLDELLILHWCKHISVKQHILDESICMSWEKAKQTDL